MVKESLGVGDYFSKAQTVKEPIEKTLNCEGYFGFGGGYAMVKGFVLYPDRGIYCNSCPLNQSCWDKHKKRTAQVWPEVTSEFERMAQNMKGKGQELVRLWWNTHKVADPYTLVMTGNIEDGAAIAQGAAPKDRGPATLSYPFEK